MIGRIQGILLDKQAPNILVDVHGIGYEIQVPLTAAYQLPELGQQVTLLTHFVVREDIQQLFGFIDVPSRTLFRALIKVNGVGPKLALAILSSMDVNDFVRCVRDGNTAALVRLPGVGKKTAERLLIEMRDRLQEWSLSHDTADVAARTASIDYHSEAEAALTALGYKPQEATRAVAAAAKHGARSSEELIRAALKAMPG